MILIEILIGDERERGREGTREGGGWRGRGREGLREGRGGGPVSQ